MADNREKFSVRTVKITGKKRGASKTFKAFWMIPAIIAGTVGTVALIGSSVVSGLGYFKQDTYVKYLTELQTQTNILTKAYNNFQANTINKLKDYYKNTKTATTNKDVDKIMEIVWNQFYSAFKIPMTEEINATILAQVQTYVSTKVALNTVGQKLGQFIGEQKTPIEWLIGTASKSIIFNLYGTKEGQTYTKTKIWQIVFGVTTAVAGLMVLSTIAYWIARIDDRVKSKKNVEALKKIAEAADEKEIEYIISKINNRYSLK